MVKCTLKISSKMCAMAGQRKNLNPLYTFMFKDLSWENVLTYNYYRKFL